MGNGKGVAPAWAYTLSIAVVLFAVSAIAGIFGDGYPNDFTKIVTTLAWITGAGGAVQFLLSRRG